MLSEPTLPLLVQVVARPVVDDQEDLAASSSTHDLLEEDEERAGVEHGRELVHEPRSFLERHDAKDVRRLAHPECVYTRLLAHPGPGSIERPVEPEARFVAERNDAAALARFFLMAGRVSRSHVAWRARSARASRLRGR